MNWGYFCALLLTSSIIAGVSLQPRTVWQWRAWGLGSVGASFVVALLTPPSVMSFLAFVAPLSTVALYQAVTLLEMRALGKR